MHACILFSVPPSPPSPSLQVPREGSDSADPYVKLYLLPDPNKVTKKKTKINKKTLNPTYNETVSTCIEYRSYTLRTYGYTPTYN